jgi:chromosomal replication initiator protein
MQYRPLAKCQAPRVDTILSIQLGVSTRLGVTRETQCSNDRHHLPTLARHVAMYLCRKLTSASLSDIQRAFNCNDHSTVVSAIKRIELMRAKDPKIDALIVELSQ